MFILLWKINCNSAWFEHTLKVPKVLEIIGSLSCLTITAEEKFDRCWKIKTRRGSLLLWEAHCLLYVCTWQLCWLDFVPSFITLKLKNPSKLKKQSVVIVMFITIFWNLSESYYSKRPWFLALFPFPECALLLVLLSVRDGKLAEKLTITNKFINILG